MLAVSQAIDPEIPVAVVPVRPVAPAEDLLASVLSQALGLLAV